MSWTPLDIALAAAPMPHAFLPLVRHFQAPRLCALLLCGTRTVERAAVANSHIALAAVHITLPFPTVPHAQASRVDLVLASLDLATPTAFVKLAFPRPCHGFVSAVVKVTGRHGALLLVVGTVFFQRLTAYGNVMLPYVFV
ncbi:Aste57867_270 [Aphanomyces stellatus]|uniref:Aste57867_270 protein n=1 Tax=Aphanomyces stellatus TaxID=120398 RepID=A0A485K4P7_9STRA|nr:hypothetical protein As57867_000270 [Aphanomyces stellatus]VFT77496.1 Aste57867_270 [Aphanomyces stellatus]